MVITVAAAELVERVRAAAAGGTPLCIEAGGTKSFYGGTVHAERLDPRPYHGVIEYEPSELVITARAGTRLAEVEALLASQGQMLGFEPPHFGAAATVGGMVAAGLAGPRRLAHGVGTGAVRDSVLGARLIDGRGDVLTVGGRVAKNVAGYDVSRALAGSLGSLGVILDVSLKVVPMPSCEVTLVHRQPETTALAWMTNWMRLPLPISATSYADGALHVRLSGGEAAVRHAEHTVGGDRLSPAEATTHWHAVRELTGLADAARPLWRLGLPADVPALTAWGPMLVEWSGQRRWVVTDAPATEIRETVRRFGGHATRFRGGDPSIPSFPAQSAAVARLECDLRAAFDPLHLFNPGRWYADPPV